MHLYKTKRRISFGAAGMAAVFLLFLLYISTQIGKMSDDMKTGDAEMLRAALDNAVVTCYAIEGSYPESVEYIEEHYGIVIDRSKYFIDYQPDIVGARPRIAVYRIEADQ